MEKKEFSNLTICVSSFSFRKGYPSDPSGNGGGFIFDCRYLHNPGRYDEFKALTGRDKAVADFLESRGEVQGFLLNVKGIVFEAITKYRQRGFTNLCVGFGCTGGRHRSVYCAENLARMIKEKFPDVCIQLNHYEQDIVEVL